MKNRKALSFRKAAGFCSCAFLFVFFVCAAPDRAAAQSGPAAGTTFVHTALGGFILGYDIDQTGTEGLLAESQALSDGKANVAVETFDQKTGKILKVVAQQNDSKNDFVTLGISGSSVGLVEFEHVTNLFVDNRLYGTLNPLNSNKVTGRWTPPLRKDDIIQSVAESQGSPNTAVMAFENGGNFETFVFSTNVAANTFGPHITISDPLFGFYDSPVMAYDSVTNQAVLGTSNGCPNCSPEIGVVDLASGAFREFTGLGFGYINGIAVDAEDGIVCTSTEIDFSVEFYNLATGEGIIVRIPGATSQAQSGQDVEYDPIHKLFLVGQEFSSSAPTGSSIQIFDTKGNFIEAVNGLSLPASPALLALHPSKRAGYVIVTPSLNELQSFTY